jgi:hypothetical protein
VVAVRTYVSSDLENPSPDELKIVTRRGADGALEAVVASGIAENMPQLLALHRALAERVLRPDN